MTEQQRCKICQKKLGLLRFTCRCSIHHDNMEFCIKHKNPEAHNCSYNFYEKHKKEIEEKNPVVEKSKVNSI